MAPRAKPKPFNGTVEVAQLILDAERMAKEDLGLNFLHAEIDWMPRPDSGDKQEYRPVLVATVGEDDDGEVESWTPAKIDRVLKRQKDNVTPISTGTEG